MSADPLDDDDPCCDWSGWHDEGDPISCNRPYGHDGLHCNSSHGIEWTDAEVAELLRARREEQHAQATAAADSIRNANVDEYTDGFPYLCGAMTLIIARHPEALAELQRFAEAQAARMSATQGFVDELRAGQP